jgi:hypothetical protein
VSARQLDAIFFVPEGPDIFLQDGLFHICYKLGRDVQFEVVLTPNVYLKALRQGNRVAAEFTSGCKIIPLQRPEPEAESGDDDAAHG